MKASSHYEAFYHKILGNWPTHHFSRFWGGGGGWGGVGDLKGCVWGRGDQPNLLFGQFSRKLNLNQKQECIPVGCVPSAAVTVLGGGCLPARGVFAQRRDVCLPGAGVSAGVCDRTPTVDRMTDTCKNININIPGRGGGERLRFRKSANGGTLVFLFTYKAFASIGP